MEVEERNEGLTSGEKRIATIGAVIAATFLCVGYFTGHYMGSTGERIKYEKQQTIEAYERSEKALEVRPSEGGLVKKAQ